MFIVNNKTGFYFICGHWCCLQNLCSIFISIFFPFVLLFALFCTLILCSYFVLLVYLWTQSWYIGLIVESIKKIIEQNTHTATLLKTNTEMFVSSPFATEYPPPNKWHNKNEHPKTVCVHVNIDILYIYIITRCFRTIFTRINRGKTNRNQYVISMT